VRRIHRDERRHLAALQHVLPHDRLNRPLVSASLRYRVPAKNSFQRATPMRDAARSADECASHSREANGRHRVRWQFEPPLVVSVGMQLERARHHAIGLLGGVRSLGRRSGQ
jgi:hypothetical protein